MMNTYYTLLNELHDALSPFDAQYKEMMLIDMLRLTTQ